MFDAMNESRAMSLDVLDEMSGQATCVDAEVVSLMDKKYGKQSLLVKSVALLMANGYTVQDIAQELGVVEEEVRNVLNQPATKEHMRRLLMSVSPERLNAIIKAAAVDAVIKMQKLLQSDDRVAFVAAKYIIDRSLGDVEAPKNPLLKQGDLQNPASAVAEIDKQIADARKRLSSKV